MNLTLENVPDDVYEALKRTASVQRRSLNAHVIDILSRATKPRADRAKMCEIGLREELERFVASIPKLEDDSFFSPTGRAASHWLPAACSLPKSPVYCPKVAAENNPPRRKLV